MNYSERFFGKDLVDLKYHDIENYFVSEKEESNTIEYKAYSIEYGNFLKNIEGIIRGICAFLNSEGGILVWGSPIGQKVEGKQEKIFVGDLSPIPELKEKDWLINKISDSVTPLPVGVNVQIIENNNHYLYIFEVQKSSYSPHQFKNTYFVRLDGQTKPAPHYLIEALFKKISFPKIEGFIKLDEISNDGYNYILDITIFMINFSEFQNEENVSYRLMCVEGVFQGSQIEARKKMYEFDGHQLVHDGYINVLHFGSPDMNNERLIIHPPSLRAKYNNKVQLLLTFGGKKSPLKASVYTLDCSKIDWDNTKNPNYLFEKIDENKLFSTMQSEIGTNREKTLKSLLKR